MRREAASYLYCPIRDVSSATDDQRKTVEGFVLGKDKQRATVHHEVLGLHKSNKELEFHGYLPDYGG